MSIIISTESTADIPEYQFREDLKIIPMGYSVNGVGYDGVTEKLTPTEFYAAVSQAKTKSDLPQTTMVTEYNATEFFDEILAAGNDLIHIAFSSVLSGTFDQETKAINAMKEKYPDRKITIIDSKSASYGEGMIAYQALLKKDEGASYEEIVKFIEEVRENTNAIFVIDDLMHLCRTGRATKNEAYIGTALRIKPVLYIANDGTLQPWAKVMSTKKALRSMLNLLLTNALKPEDTKFICVGHADNLEDAQLLVDAIKEAGYKNVGIYDFGPVIGTHVGKDAVSVVFLGNRKDESIKNA